MELIVTITLLSTVIIVNLIKGINITIRHDYPDTNVVNKDLYAVDSDIDEEEDYLKEFLSEVHDLMEGDDTNG